MNAHSSHNASLPAPPRSLPLPLVVVLCLLGLAVNCAIMGPGAFRSASEGRNDFRQFYIGAKLAGSGSSYDQGRIVEAQREAFGYSNLHLTPVRLPFYYLLLSPLIVRSEPQMEDSNPRTLTAVAELSPEAPATWASCRCCLPEWSPEPPMETRDPKLFINRELSWLEFNERVLAEARDASLPVYERLKFLAIVASNLDEFFMVRVAGLKQQLASGVAETAADGMLPPSSWRPSPSAPTRWSRSSTACCARRCCPALAQRMASTWSRRTHSPAEQKAAARTHFRPERLPGADAAGGGSRAPVSAPAQQVAQHRGHRATAPRAQEDEGDRARRCSPWCRCPAC